jgi:hypothetical protein
VSSGHPIVIVDARNVMRSRWPNFSEERFLELIRAWADAEGAHLVAVFDGRAPGGGAGSHEIDERTTIVGTGGGSADDWIAEHAPELARVAGRLWLVSSDGELRARVGDHAERAIGGGSFATQLEALDRDRGGSRD